MLHTHKTRRMNQTPRAVAQFIRVRGGALPYRELDAGGVTREAVAAALAARALVRVRPGWFATPDAPRDVVRATHVGGVVTAASAARLDGLWLLDDPMLHVRVPRTASRLRPPDATHERLNRVAHKVCVHYRSDPPARSARDPLPLAIAEMLACAEQQAAIIAIDSALTRGMLDSGRPRRGTVARAGFAPEGA